MAVRLVSFGFLIFPLQVFNVVIHMCEQEMRSYWCIPNAISPIKTVEFIKVKPGCLVKKRHTCVYLYTTLIVADSSAFACNIHIEHICLWVRIYSGIVP